MRQRFRAPVSIEPGVVFRNRFPVTLVRILTEAIFQQRGVWSDWMNGGSLMRVTHILPLVVLTAGVFVASADRTAAQSYHDGRFIGGADRLFVYDVQRASATLVLTGIRSTGHRMDRDNRRVVFSDTNGLYRFDPASPQLPPQTVAVLPMGHFPERFIVNQDGDYIVNVFRSASPAAHHVLKISYNGGVRTIFSTGSNQVMGRNPDHVCINIDTGHYLVSANTQTGNAPVLEVSDAGSVATWNKGQQSPSGPKRGWDGFRSMCQNHRNGFLEAPEQQYLYQLKPGTGTPTTLSALPAGVEVIYGASGFDLQTAARPRWYATGTTTQRNATLAYIIDRNSFAVTSVTVVRNAYWFNRDFDFYRGRHIQTVKTGTHRWTILLSCPRSPGRPYALAAGLSGARPGVVLPDGRRINLTVDHLTHATLNNRLPMVFNPGASRLDATGEARGWIDLSALNPPPGGFGLPLWIAMAVLDPQAPNRIKYLPDTYVMRI